MNRDGRSSNCGSRSNKGHRRSENLVCASGGTEDLRLKALHGAMGILTGSKMMSCFSGL